MPDKRYSLKVNGQSRTVKADVFNQNIDKFVNDMPDATITMQGSDGTTREYRLRDISDAYDAGYSFAETDTPIYVNSKPKPAPAQKPAGTVTEAPVTQEAAAQPAAVPTVEAGTGQMTEAEYLAGYDPEVIRRFQDPSNRAGNFKDIAQIAGEYAEEQKRAGARTNWNTTGGAGYVPPMQFPAGQQKPAVKPVQKPAGTSAGGQGVPARPTPLMPEEKPFSLTPFADRAKEVQDLADSPELNKYWAERQQEAGRRMVEKSPRGFAYMMEGIEQAEVADAARRLNRSKYDEQHFDAFFDKSVAPIFGEEREKGNKAAVRAADAYPASPMPGAVGGYFGKAVAVEKYTDPEKIAGETIGRVQKDDSFGNYIMARMGIDTEAESDDGARVPQLSEREKEWMNRLFAKETGEVADQIVQRIYDQYQKENAPKSTLDYILGKAFHENLAASLGDAIVRRAAHSSGMREQLRAMASDAYGQGQSWGVRMIGGAAPFAVDMVAGGFALPNLVGEAVVKGGVGLAAKQVTKQMAKRATARGLEGAALKEATSGAAGMAERYLATQAPIVNLAIRSAGSAANFATYDMQSEIVRQIGDGEFRPFDLMKEAVHGATVGAVMGAAGGTIGHLTRNAGRAGKVMGGIAGLGAETTIFGVSNGLAKAQAEGEDISSVDWADTMGEAFGQVVGMKAVGAVMHPREFLNRYRKSNDYDLQLNARDLDELRQAGYDFDGVFKGLGKFGEVAPMEASVVNRATEYTAGPEGTGRKRTTTSEEAWVDAEAYENLMRNPEISSSTKRKIAYIATGKVLMPEPVFGVQMDVDADGKVSITTMNAYGHPIETKDYASEEAAQKDYGELQGVSRRNTIDGLERIAARAGFPDLVDEAKGRTKNETGGDVDDVLTNEHRDKEAADAILDNYIKNLQEAYMQRFNEKLKQLGGREGGDASDVGTEGGGIDNAGGEAGANSGTGADNPPAPPANSPTPPPAPPTGGNGGGSVPPAGNETMSRREAAYNRGASMKEDTSGLPAINYEVKLADARLAAQFPSTDPQLARLRNSIMQAVESGDDETADRLIDAARGRLTGQQIDAIEQYRDLMETQRGVEDAITQQVKEFEEHRRVELEQVAALDGTITPLQLNDGSVVYYKSGNLQNKYGGVMVATDDGQTMQIPTSSIQTIGERQKLDDIVNADIDQYAQELETNYQAFATGTQFFPLQEVDMVMAGKAFRGTMIGSDPAGNYTFKLEDGSQIRMTPQDAAKAVSDADALKIQAQLQQENETAAMQQQTERYAKGIAGFADGKPDYSAPESDPQTVADYLKSMSQDGSNAGILKNIEGESGLLMQNMQQAWDEHLRARNAIEMNDDDLQKKAKAMQDAEGARRRLVELEARRRKWGEIRQAVMTPEERAKYEGERQRAYGKALTAAKKEREAQVNPDGEPSGTVAVPIPTAQELLSQYREQGEAEEAVTALRKETARQWREDLFPQLDSVRKAVSDYQRGLVDYDEEDLRNLSAMQADLEAQETALVARSKELKKLEQSLGRVYAGRNNADLSPHEKKVNQLAREKDRAKKMQLAKQAYADDPTAAAILENDEPQDVYEFVSRNLGYGSLNWEGMERGDHHVRGLQEELGSDKTRSLDRDGDTYGFNAYLAPTGEGMGIDEAVHSIYEAQPDGEGGKAYSTEDIKNALLDMLQSASKPTDISHRIENDRIAQAEQVWRANEENALQRAEEEAAIEEAEYQDYLETLRGLIPTEEAENFISGLMADEIAEIEADRAAYIDALRQMMPDDDNPENIEDYGETANQQQPATTGSGRVDNQPQRAAVEAGVGKGEETLQGAGTNQPASETGDTGQPAPQPAGAGTGVGTTDADGSVPVSAEAGAGRSDLDAPEELAGRISIAEDYITGNGENGDIYLQTVTIDGQHEVVKVDEPDKKGNYNGSYYEYDGQRFGDLLEVINHIDGKAAETQRPTEPATEGPKTFTERLEAAKAETDTAPTEAQKAAGNYKKGHIEFGGYRMSIENPKGSVRSGVDRNGQPWSITMQDTYGYIGRKYGADRDHLDFFINDDADLDAWNGRVFVIDQRQEDGTFDEHKVMYGYPNWAAAKKAYERNYEAGWWDKHVMQMLGAKKANFDKWLADSDHKTKPYAEYFRTKMLTDTVSDPVSDMLATVAERKEASKFDRTIPADEEAAKQVIADIVEKATSAKDKMHRSVVSGITERQKKDFAEKGIEVDDDYVHSIENSAVRHNQNRHGDAAREARRGQLPITADDYQRIPDILENYTTVEKSPNLNSKGNEVIIYTKEYPDGTVYYLEEQRDRRKSLAFETMYKKNGTDTSDGLMSETSPLTSATTSDNLNSGGKDTNNIPNIQGNREEFLPSDEEIEQRNALVDVMRKAGIDVSLKFSEGQQGLTEADGDYSGITFQKVTDEATLKQLNEGPTVKRLRAMQMIDGKLYPPMSAKVGKEMREPTEVGVWEQSEERPDLIDKNGKFKLDKAQKGQTSVPAAYNPYFHTSTSGLNDQFTSAYKRPELVVVEVEIPESELTSGYKAQGAKDAVGNTDWHSGVVNGALPKDRQRTVTLSRWSKVVRVVPDSEMADMVAKQLEGTGIEVPYNVVTPNQRKELEARGVKISATPAGTVTEDINGNPIKKSGGRRYFRTSKGEVYGYVQNGKIYIDPTIADSETPIHEFSHLWWAALQRENPEEAKNVVEVMKGCKDIWEQVQKDNPGLTTDDEIADEVLARYSGRRGRARLEAIRKQLEKREGEKPSDKEKALTAIEKLKNILNKVWETIGDFLGIHYTKPEQVADQVMRDMLNGVNPNKARRNPTEPEGPSGEPAQPAEGKGYQIEPRFHKKKGINIYAVKFGEHFDREKFLELKKQVKEFGGYYSSYGKGGFIFEDSEADARRFAESVTKSIDNETEQQTAADTATIVSETAVVVSEAERVAEAADTPPAEVVNQTVEKIDAALDRVNKQLALLGYYEGGKDVPFQESYGYMKSAEKKALKDANDLAKKIGAAIGYDTGRKQIAKANIAPTGGDISIHLPFSEGKEVLVNIMLDAEGDNLRMRSGYFRVDGTGKPGWYGINQFFEPEEPLDRLLQRIEGEVRHSAPEYTIKQIAQKGASKPKKPAREAAGTVAMGDLFAQVIPETASKEVILEQAKGLVKEVVKGLRDVASDEQRDTLQQWIDEAIESVPMDKRSAELDKAITTAIKAVHDYERRKADEYQAQVEESKRLFPKDGEERMKELEGHLREEFDRGYSGGQTEYQLQDLFIKRLTDEGVGLMEQVERWKEYIEGLHDEWRRDAAEIQRPTEPTLRPATEADLDERPEVYHEGKPTQIVAVMRSTKSGSDEATIDSIHLTNGKRVKLEDLQVKDEKTASESTGESENDVTLQQNTEPIKTENDEREGTTSTEGASDATELGVDASGTDGGVQPRGTGGVGGSGNAGAEPTGNARGTVRRKKRVVEAGTLFDAGDFGDTEEPTTGAVRVRPAGGERRNDGTGAGDGRGRQDGGGSTGPAESKPQVAKQPTQNDSKRADDGSVKTAREKSAPLNTRNYLYPKDAGAIDSMSPRERLKANVRALEILRDVLHEGREATAEERAELGKFRGWGGIDTSRWYDLDYMRRLSTDRFTPGGEELTRLADVLGELDPDGKRKLLDGIRGAGLTSYYTPTAVGRSINKFFELAGYSGGGSFIDGSMGNGVLEGTMPKAMQQRTQIHGTELDWLTGQIAKQLYPDANVKIQGFQDLDAADGSFDLAGSNIPFGDIKVYDRNWGHTSDPVKRAAQGKIHNYFVVKKIDLVKPGGLLYIMTSNAVMDTKSNQIIRQYIADQCEILGAMRLPDNTFKGAGTKVVTDVIFLRKFKDGEDALQTRQGDYLEQVEKPFLTTTTQQAQGRYETYTVEYNGYYGSHPDMMIGTVKAGGQYRDDEFGLTSDMSTEDIAKKMDSLMKKHIVPASRQGQLYDTHKTERQVHEAIRESYKGDGDYISSGNIVEQGGKFGVVVITKGNADFQEIPGLKSQGAKIRAMMPLRRAMKELISEEIGGASDASLTEKRKVLQQAYDAYVRKYGRLQDKGSKYIADDIDGYTLMSLEKWKDGKFEGLSDIFTKSTIKPRLNLDNATTPSELITLSLAEYGEIRDSFMRDKLGDNWLEQCGDTLFEIPFGRGYQIRALYLSGDVKSKLEDAERAAKENPAFQKNVEALKEVMPKDIPFVGISIHMGARWVPEHIYTDFLCDLLGISEANPKSSIKYMPEADQFQVYVSALEPSGKAKDYQTPHRDVTALLEAALKNNKVKITTTDRDGNEVFLEEETNSANDKIQDIREKFEDWLSKDRDRVQELEKLYNDKFNRTVIPHYDGSHLQIPGLQGMELRPHQKDAVWMLINNRGGIIDHIVGAGKTLVMQASIMEMRRMGIAKKPMIIALKATVPQMAAEFRQAFPAARILAPTEKDFSTANRKKLLSNISLNDWDCVILSHEQYGMLPHTEEVETGVFREQLQQLEAAISLLHGGDMSQMTKKQLKGLEKRKKSLEAKMQKLLDRKVDREFTFESLGVDYLFVDECQQFKSLPYVTTHQNVKGLASPEGSGRATALLCGARYLQQMHQGDRGITLLSGTTISNSLVELYSLFQYVRPNKMAELGFNTFDAWAANFAECSSELEYNHTNELVMSSRFRTFDNVPELAKLYTEVADVRNDMNLKLPKPKMKVHEVIVPASDALAEIADECAKMCKTKSGRYFGIPDKTASGKEQPWALLATNISTKAAINVKLVNTSLDDGDGGKIRYVCDNVKEIYDKFHEQKGTQMIFCDLGVPGPDKEYDVYNDIINRLVNDYGIPREEIVDIHVANTDQKKKALFKKVNDGDVRVLIAGAKNGGTGVNVQKRLIAVHHVDMSWNPANITQENGRAARQGNWLAKEHNNDQVEVYYYATEKSLDLYKYQLVSSKQAMIDKFKAGATSDERSFDEGEADDDSGFSPASIVALLSGNPIIMEKAKMDKKVEKLIKSKRQYMVEHEQRVYDYQSDQQHLKNFENLVERNAGDRKILDENGFKPDEKGVYPATVTVYSDKDTKKQTFEKPGEAGKRIHYLVNSGDKVTIEGYGMTAEIGFPEESFDGKMVRNIRLKAPSGITYSVELSNDDTAAGTSMRRLLKQVIDNGEKYAGRVEYLKHKLDGGDPGEANFPKEEELKAALEEKKRIDAEYAKLSAEKKPDGEQAGAAAGGETMKRRGGAAEIQPHTARQMEAYRREAIETAEQLGGTEIHFDQRPAEPGVKGWFDTGDNSIHVVADAIEDAQDLKRTIFHEKLGHEGLKALFGSNEGVNQWGQFLFGSAGKKIRQRIIDRAEREGYDWSDPLRFSKAAQEVFADIAEAGPRNTDEFGLWRRAKHLLIKKLNEKGLRIPGILNDHDLRYYVLKTGEALKTWDGMSEEAQREAGNRMYSRAGKPRKRRDESMAQYLQRLRSWEKWKIADEQSKAAGDPMPDKEQIDKKYEDEYKADLDAWKQANGIASDQQGLGEFPKRQAGESPQEYALRVAAYETEADTWKDAPSYFDYMQRAQEEYRDEYEAWKSRYNLVEAESVDMSMYEGTSIPSPTSEEDMEVEARMEQDLGDAVGVALDSEGARRHAKVAVIERRKNLESSNAEDAIWLYDLRKKIDDVAKGMGVTGKELREALPFIIEGTYFEDILRDENGHVVAIVDISDQLPIKKGPELDALLDDIKQWYDNFYHSLEDAGLRYDAGYIAEGYVNHVWDKGKSDPKAWEQVVENYQRTKSPNMRHREIDTYREGMDIGLVPKYTDICDILAHYSRQNNEALANKKFLDDLSFMVVQEVNGDGEVVANWPLLDSSKPSFGDDKYVMYHVPGVGDVWVLKDIQRRFANIFGTMRTQDAADWLSKLGKGYDLVGSTAKKIQLALSGFHALALWEVDVAQNGPVAGLHDLFKYIVADSYRTGTIPAYAHPEDFKFAAKHLVQLGATEDYAASDVNAITATLRAKVKEWYESENHGKKAAGAAATPLAVMMDWINKGFDTVLWNYLHDGLKIASFKRFAEQVDERVRKQGLSEEQREKLLDEAGQYVNDMFGGQYWELLNVSPATLKWMRRAFLSPDWLLSTQRHFFANFGFGSLYNDSGFMNYVRYNADNIKRAFGADIARNEERRFRSRNAKMCYLIGALFFWQVIYNAFNALNRLQDEEREAAKADEIRKTNPDYKSPYELAYPDGMKWYDYTMWGNSLGQQTHLFTGRYEDGTETYVRWGKQFREFPELFIGKHGFEFPTPILERMQAKANPVIGGVIDALGSLDVNGFKESYQNRELREKYGKEIATLATTARHFMPFGIPTQAEKEYKWLDFFMPSSKGFSRYKAVDYFKTFILAGDMRGVEQTYNAAVMNGVDAEKCLQSAISTLKATQRKEMQDGVIDLQTAIEKFDNADGWKDKSVLKNKVVKYLAAEQYRTFTREEAMEKVDGYLNGAQPEAEKDNEKYIELAKSDDVIHDYKLSALGKQAKGYVDRVKTCDNAQTQAQLARQYEAWFAIDGIVRKARSDMNRLKGQLGKGHDAEVMEQIRHIRQQAQTEIDHVQPPK